MKHPTVTEQITFLSTGNLENTAEFYEQTLGLKLVLDQGGCRIYRICEDGFLGFCQREKVASPARNVIFTLVTPDVDGWYEYLSRHDVDIPHPPRENPEYQIYHFFIKDPQGYWIEFQSFLDPGWREAS